MRGNQGVEGMHVYDSRCTTAVTARIEGTFAFALDSYGESLLDTYNKYTAKNPMYSEEVDEHLA
jgi:hypothetical protein